jgi:type II secretory pathway component GspD/PulD (secretin)
VQLQEWLEAIDVPQQQVAIEVKFVEARAEDVKNLGIEWVSSVSLGVGGAALDASGSTSGDGTVAAEDQTGSFSYLNDLNTSEIQWGTFGVTEIRAMINYLVETGNAKVESRPRVSVMDNEVANIHVTITNPVQTVNRFSEGAFVQDVVTWQYIETGLKLMVRPRVSDDGYVSLHVNPSFEEILAFVGPADAPAPVTAKRSIETTVKVRSGETLVLGGLMRETEIKNVKKVWLLGDIPILGALFRSTRTSVEQDELLIVITPQILPPGYSAAPPAGP